MQIFLIYIVLVICFPSMGSVKTSPCARWNTTGITVVGNKISENATDRLGFPQGIFIHEKTNTLYVADIHNARIIKFLLDGSSTMGDTVVSKVYYPDRIFVDDDDDKNGLTLYVSIPSGDHVKKWVIGASTGQLVGGKCLSCTGVWVDKEKNVYMSALDEHQILKWSAKTNQTTVIAGHSGEEGSTADRLNSPQGIYIDQTSGTLHVADTQNNRIQAWPKDSKEGVTVAGLSNGTSGQDAASLSEPTSVRFDEETHIFYIADTFNNRIQRWLSNASKGDTIVGLSMGNGTNQLNQPTDLAFDSAGNLYVCDRANDRIQLFVLIDNRPCSTGSPTSLLT